MLNQVFAPANSLTKPKEKYLLAFFIAFVAACALFIPYIIFDHGYFLFYGDYNVQQVPFYKLAHEAVRNGDFGWNFRTDLGVNFISSYSFYLLGSPFFWLTIPFPTDFVPHLMGPLLILKFSFASLTAYAYLTKFAKDKNYALIGALLYAFSGFSVYNIFFNHFHEAIVYFPLLLLSLELLMKENRRGVFFLMVALCALSNYYFFFGMVIFVILYFIVRVLSGDWNLDLKSGYTWSRILAIGYESVLGLLASGVIMLPALMGILENSRIGSSLTGWSGLAYSKTQIYQYILQCFFFPPDLPARPVFFTGADVKWASVAGWLPIFSMTGVIAWLRVKKGSWQKRLITISGVMAFIPFLNSAFSAFNYNYYARWFYMPILIMVLVTVMSLEDAEVELFPGWVWTTGITTAFILLIGFFPTGQHADKSFSGYGLYDSKYTDRFWITSGIAVGGLILMYLLMVLKKSSKKTFTRAAIASICVVSVLYSSYFVAMGKTSSYDTKGYIIPVLLQNDDVIEVQNEKGEVVKASAIDDARFDVYEGMDNTLMYLNLRGIQAFQSIVPGSVMEFYNYVGVERTVGSRPEAEIYALRGLLSTKYLIDYAGDNNDFESSDGNVKIPYFSAYSPYSDETDRKGSEQNSYYVYKNKYFVPYGFTYDYYMSQEYCDSFEETDRAAVMMKAILLNDEQIEKYKGILTDINEFATSDQMSEEHLTLNFYRENCIDRAATSCSSFSTGKSEFTATTTLQKDNLVFFSIPYENGWSATIDGVETDIEKVNAGFMAVLVPGDGQEHTIHFSYHTPGLKGGIIATVGSVVIVTVYLTVFYYKKRRAGDPEDTSAMPEDHSVEFENGFKIIDYSLADGVSEITPEMQAPVEEKGVPPTEKETGSLNKFTIVNKPEEEPFGDQKTSEED